MKETANLDARWQLNAAALNRLSGTAQPRRNESHDANTITNGIDEGCGFF
jgi:hypothetical protein